MDPQARPLMLNICLNFVDKQLHVKGMPSKNTLGVKKGEAKSEAPVNVKITSESIGN